MNLRSLPLFRRPATLSALAVFAASPLWSAHLRPLDYEGGRSRDEAARAHRNSSSVASMLGEVRTAISDILFIKTERYLHSGVAYVSHVQDEVLSVSGAMEHADEHQAEVGLEHDHEHEHEHDAPDRDHAHADEHDHHHDHAHTAELLLRSQENDFRHWIGRMERAVKPYNPPGQLHVHTDGRELLPWFRTMTLSDPNYVTGYATGAWWLKSRNPAQALQYINEGIEHNPDAFQMYFTKGQILMSAARQLDADLKDLNAEARRPVDEARHTFQHGAELVRAQWPESETWSEYQLDDAWALLRMAVVTEHRFGDAATATARARHYLETCGEDPTLRRIAASP